MIKAIRNGLFSVNYNYESSLEAQRAQALVIVNMISLLGASLWLFLGFVNTLLNSQTAFLATPTVLILPAIFVAIHVMVQRGMLQLAAWIYVLILLAVTAVTMTQGLQGSADLTLFLALIASSAVLNRRGVLIVMFLVVGALVIGLTAQLRLTDPVTVTYANNALRDFIGLILTLGVSFLILYLFTSQLQNISEGSRGELDSFQQLSRFLSELVAFEDDEEDRAIARVLNFCMRDLGFSYAQFYHTSADGLIIRRVRTGFGMQIVADVSTDIELSEGNAIVQAARNRTLEQASFRDMVPRRRHFLPTTTYSIAVPIVYHDQLVGILDIQNNRSRPFSANEVELVQYIGKGIGMVVNVVREVMGLRNDLKQEQLVSANLRMRGGSVMSSASREAELLWDSMQMQGEGSSYGMNLNRQEGAFIAATDLPADMLNVLAGGDIHVEKQPDKQVITVPILLNQEVLGAMTFNLAKDRKLSERQMELTQIIARRLALALENRRLLERTQSQAERERKANETANELMGATDVRAVLDLAANRFNEVLGAISTRIEVQIKQDERGEEQPL